MDKVATEAWPWLPAVQRRLSKMTVEEEDARFEHGKLEGNVPKKLGRFQVNLDGPAFTTSCV